ncbi:Dehydrogenase reductase SDR member 4 [Irineochytrium annulatum]|nr:Dehydrogenase reductase SDR member 4 [Irineochytrium annulatum]
MDALCSPLPPMGKLAGRVVVVSGGSGTVVAHRLADEGANVVLDDDGSAVDNEGCREIVEETVRDFGRIDVLIHCVAVAPTNEGLMDLTPASLSTIRHPLLLIRQCLPHMPPGSRVIFITPSTTTSSMSDILQASTSGALEQMARVLAKELGPKEITVNTVVVVESIDEKKADATGMMEDEGDMDEEYATKGGMGDKVGEAVVMLAGRESGWMNGQRIMV